METEKAKSIILKDINVTVKPIVRQRSNFKKGHDGRHLQTEIVQKLSDRQNEFSGCSKATNLYEKLGQNRIRVQLFLRINDQGKVDKFTSKTPRLPEAFLDCLSMLKFLYILQKGLP